MKSFSLVRRAMLKVGQQRKLKEENFNIVKDQARPLEMEAVVTFNFTTDETL